MNEIRFVLYGTTDQNRTKWVEAQNNSSQNFVAISMRLGLYVHYLNQSW